MLRESFQASIIITIISAIFLIYLIGLLVKMLLDLDDDTNSKTLWIPTLIYIIAIISCALIGSNCNIIVASKDFVWMAMVSVIIPTCLIIGARNNYIENRIFLIFNAIAIIFIILNIFMYVPRKSMIMRWEIGPDIYYSDINEENEKEVENKLYGKDTVCAYNELDNYDGKTTFILIPESRIDNDELQNDIVTRVFDKNRKEELYKMEYFAIQKTNETELEEVAEFKKNKMDNTEGIMLVIIKENSEKAYWLLTRAYE